MSSAITNTSSTARSSVNASGGATHDPLVGTDQRSREFLDWLSHPYQVGYYDPSVTGRSKELHKTFALVDAISFFPQQLTKDDLDKLSRYSTRVAMYSATAPVWALALNVPLQKRLACVHGAALRDEWPEATCGHATRLVDKIESQDDITDKDFNTHTNDPNTFTWAAHSSTRDMGPLGSVRSLAQKEYGTDTLGLFSGALHMLRDKPHSGLFKSCDEFQNRVKKMIEEEDWREWLSDGSAAQSQPTAVH